MDNHRWNRIHSVEGDSSSYVVVEEDIPSNENGHLVSSSPTQGDVTPERGGSDLERGTKTTENTLGRRLLEDFVEETDVAVEEEPYRRIILVVIPVFMAYACLFALQGHLKDELNVSCGATSDETFGRAVSALYIGNLVFRFAHNIILFPLTPRGRTCLSMSVLMLSLAVLGFGVFTFKIHRMSMVWLAYGLGGMGIGSFESNLLSAITPLGHRTKMWATQGIPIGVVCVTVGSFFLISFDVPVRAIYVSVFSLLALGMVVFLFFVPYRQIDDNGDSFSAFVEDLRQWRRWLPQTKWYALCLGLDMLAVSTFSPGVMLYIFPKDARVHIFGLELQQSLFFALYNLFTFAGGFIGRRFAYMDSKLRSPHLFLFFSALGVIINILFSKFWWCPSMFPIAGFLIFFANGSIYNRACRHIDDVVPKSFNLTALSFWLFLGDMGSVTGANLMQYLKQWMVGDISC